MYHEPTLSRDVLCDSILGENKKKKTKYDLNYQYISLDMIITNLIKHILLRRNYT